MPKRRLPSHIIVVVVFLMVAALHSLKFDIVESAEAAPVATPTPVQSLLRDDISISTDAVRDVVSTRALIPTPVPLPQPIPVDPNATPLPSPTPEPVAIAPAPAAPLPVVAAPLAVAAVSGWLSPVPMNIGQYFSAGHPAIDIIDPCGTPVVASLPGTIIWSGWKDNGGGNVVAVDSGNGYVLEYNHMQAVALASGTWVAAGTVIGWVGATGWATGCHLHFTVIHNGIYEDPLAYL